MCLKLAWRREEGNTHRVSQACPEHEPSTSTTFKHTHTNTHSPIRAHLPFFLTHVTHPCTKTQTQSDVHACSSSHRHTLKLLPCNYKVHAKSSWTCTVFPCCSSRTEDIPLNGSLLFLLPLPTSPSSLFNKMSSFTGGKKTQRQLYCLCVSV